MGFATHLAGACSNFVTFFWLCADEAAALMALPGAEQRLELTQADSLDYRSLVECFTGCDGVFHTSSPSDLVSNYPVSGPTHSPCYHPIANKFCVVVFFSEGFQLQ